MPRKVRPLLTVIVPTIGRNSLEHTLNSITSQPGAEEVEVIVVADTHGRQVTPVKYHDLKGELFDYSWAAHDAGFNCWGHPQRNYAMPLAAGRYIVSLDDDDTWDPGALEAIRRAVSADVEPRFHIFKMKYATGDLLWRWPTLMFGNIGTPMMVFPNDMEKLGSWGRAYEGDFFFLQTTLANMGESSVAWHDSVLAHIRPAEALR
jgi:glycosyltransferase involved in cell wall biosynthesis